jgi:hypothetical protein
LEEKLDKLERDTNVVILDKLEECEDGGLLLTDNFRTHKEAMLTKIAHLSNHFDRVKLWLSQGMPDVYEG